jgi:hypothetical protein
MLSLDPSYRTGGNVGANGLQLNVGNVCMTYGGGGGGNGSNSNTVFPTSGGMGAIYSNGGTVDVSAYASGGGGGGGNGGIGGPGVPNNSTGISGDGATEYGGGGGGGGGSSGNNYTFSGGYGGNGMSGQMVLLFILHSP